MTLRYEEIAEILKIIDSSNCDEVSIETGEIKLFVRCLLYTSPSPRDS